jgi:hypothetical protein
LSAAITVTPATEVNSDMNERRLCVWLVINGFSLEIVAQVPNRIHGRRNQAGSPGLCGQKS